MKHVVVRTRWTHDQTAERTDESDLLDEDDFVAWQAEVRATAIHDGRFVVGSAYMGEMWLEISTSPTSDPQIGGYYPQMLEEALEELRKRLPETHPATAEIDLELKTMAAAKGTT